MFVVPVNAMKGMGDFEVYIHSFLTSALCGERVTGQLLALTVLLYDLQLPAATADEDVGLLNQFGRSEKETPELQLLPDTEIDPTACQKPA